ncbi:RNA polymerase sigma factor, sigma-70 family [Catalinimonas alkaloidigena]|uniref:RNA polymerase sigma factor, sigma-70 family n=2 Tax=Catalinimonas alkaloidigena TaxID=1075417 RepID=A0A1G9KH81_9BACT|nr:RNA polymerase sigma factor, sigma-70 family [Catalinimonas alkaloidigena]
MPEYESEEAVWRAFRQGDRAAFQQLYHRFANVLFNYGSKFTADRDLVRDAIQELFLRLWRDRTRLGDTTSVKYYLFKALRRDLVRALQRKARFVAEASLSGPAFAIEYAHEVALMQEELWQEQQDRLNLGLEQLSPRQREAIFLRFYENLSYQEVAEVMSITPKSTYKIIYKAIEMLQKHFKVFCLWLF